MAKSPTISGLLCYEGSTNLEDDDDGYYSKTGSEDDSEWEAEEDFPVTQDDDEHVKALLDKEIKENVGRPILPESSMVVSGDWIKDSRKEAVKYILSTSQSNGFRRQTAYVAIAYHDAFLSREVRVSEVEEHWILRLAAVACLSLASKYEETMAISLSMFPTTENYEFNYKILQKTELMVLNKLDWRMQILTPFAFTYYFVSKFFHYQTTASSSLGNLTSKAEAIILNAITEDEKIMRHHKPSTIAAAAALLITDGNSIKETMKLKINALSLNAYLRTEEIFSLYNQLKRQREKWGSTSSPVPSSIPVLLQLGKKIGDGDGENSDVISVRSAKRKSITFSECGVGDNDGESRELTQTKRSC